MKAAAVPIAIRESILGLPLNNDLKPIVKYLYPTIIVGVTKINCTIAKFQGFIIGSIISGNFIPNISPNI
ncbi:hypothetical protein SDC9_113947 [bioreactor metagenome]|uniref:Uncharacterized protein n=1 Tax=bioreactor metagenome TaxID=1076179 RepID=A0A645BR05_9ZZZZ